MPCTHAGHNAGGGTVALASGESDETAEVTEVATFAELVKAVNTDKKANVKLTADIDYELPAEAAPSQNRLKFDGNMEYVLNLNGHTLKVTNKDNEDFNGQTPFILVSGTSKLTVQGDGSISFSNYHTNSSIRDCYANVLVKDSAELITQNVALYGNGRGATLYLRDTAKATVNGGNVYAQDGFAIHAIGNSALTLDYGVMLNTFNSYGIITTEFDNGMGSLYFASEGDLTVSNAYFAAIVQIHKSQVDEFDITKKEVTITGSGILEKEICTEYHGEGSIPEGYAYCWQDCVNNTRVLYKVDGGVTKNIRVIDTTRKFPITVNGGVAKIGGTVVTEASYGTWVKIEANTPESGYVFDYWEGNDNVFFSSDSDKTEATTQFRMQYGAAELTAKYGKERIQSLAIIIPEPQVGEPLSMTATTAGDIAVCTGVKWNGIYGSLRPNYEKCLLAMPGYGYGVTLTFTPAADDGRFASDLTATVNGNAVTAYVQTDGSVSLYYAFSTPLTAPFSVLYTTNEEVGQNSTITVDIEKMADEDSDIMAAYLSDEITYQWYKNGVAIEGATDVSYKVDPAKAENGDLFQVKVTVDGNVSVGTPLTYSDKLLGEVSLTVGTPTVGQRASDFAPQLLTEGLRIDKVARKRATSATTFEYDNVQYVDFFFAPGETYTMAIFVYPPEGKNFGSTTAYVNGEKAYVANYITYARIEVTFTMPAAEFSAIFTITDTTVEIGTTLALDIDKIKTDSDLFKTAYEAGKVTYQWYADGVAIEGATDAEWTAKVADVGKLFQCVVTADGKVSCTEEIYVTNIVSSLDITMPELVESCNVYKHSDSYEKDGKAINFACSWFKVGSDTSTVYFTPGESYWGYVMFELPNGLTCTDATTLANNIKINGIAIDSIIAEQNTSDGTKRITVKTAEYTAKAHVHTYDETKMSTSGTHHWLECIDEGCPDKNGSVKDKQKHSGGTLATCKSPAICTCGTPYGALGGHSFGEWNNEIPATCVSEGTKGYKDCSVCNKHFNNAGVEITDLTIAKNDNHLKAETWSKDASGHWYVCTREGCTAGKLDFAAHTPSATAATETMDIHCTVCGYVIQSVLGHTHNLQKVSGTDKGCLTDGAKTYWECSGGDHPCHKYFEDAEGTTEITEDINTWKVIPAGHNYGTLIAEQPATCINTGLQAHYECSVCHKLFNESYEEKTATELVIDKSSHTFGDWIDEVPATTESDGTKGHKDCSVCHDHFDTDGNKIDDLTIPKLGSPNDPDTPVTPDDPTTPSDEQKDGLSGGAIAGIVIGSVAVAGIGGFAIFWFVIKKKKWADLVAVFKNLFAKK